MAAMKAKHAFGALERIDESIKSGVIDAYDILFVKNADGKPYVGWVDKDGNKVVVSNDDEIAKLESGLATKASAEAVEAVEVALEAKADTETVKAMEEELASKISAEEVDAKVESAVTKKVESVVEKTAEKTKYEIVDAPIGTLVKMNENEIRICCPANSEWTLQNVGVGGDPNTYYVTFKTYVYDDNVVGYKEHLGGSVDAEILTDLKTDEYGRRYQPTWLGVAKYDETTDTWAYYGASSTGNKMIGWDYQLDLFNADGVMIASDSVRINLSNENCHFEIKPYYISGIMNEVDTKIEEKVETIVEEKMSEIDSSYEIIEF